MIENKKKIVAICGKSGAGKDLFARKLVEKYPDMFHKIISCTTRSIREGEVHGKNYYYLTKEEFLEKLLNNDLLEAVEFNGWFYGTPFSSLSDGINLGVFNPEGLEIILDDPRLEVIIFYINASDKTRMIRCLNRENNPDVKEIIRRYATDEKDFDDIVQKPIFIITNEKEDDFETNLKNIYETTIKYLT